MKLRLVGYPPTSKALPLCFCRYEEITAWMEEQARIEIETEAKTARWLELADLE